MRPPQVQSRGSASKTFLINRAHVLRASIEKSELSRSKGFAAGNAPAVGIGPVKSLTMASPIRDMRRNAVNPFERIHLDGSCAGPWIGRRFQNQIAVCLLFKRIHSQYRPGDVPGLRFQGGDFGGIDWRTGKHGKSRVDPGQKILHEALR